MKNKISTIVIILVTVILAGVAVFTAIRLYDLRQTSISPISPESKPAAAESSCNLSFNLTTSTSTPTATPTVEVSCQGSVPIATITWTSPGGVTQNYYVDVNDHDNAWNTTDGFWHKHFTNPSSLTTIIPTGFTNAFNDILPMPALIENTIYYARVLYGATQTYSPTVSFTTTTCATGTSTPTATATATATASPTASPVPQCNNACTENSQCPSNLICVIASGATTGNCRNTSCQSETDCTCATNPPTTGISTPTQPSLPDSGTSWPTIAGVSLGIFVIIGSFLLAL